MITFAHLFCFAGWVFDLFFFKSIMMTVYAHKQPRASWTNYAVYIRVCTSPALYCTRLDFLTSGVLGTASMIASRFSMTIASL